jgi:hypothetical protein
MGNGPQALQTLGTSVENTVGAEASAGTLIEGLSGYIRAHANDPAAIIDFANKLDTAKADLAAKVAANPVPDDGSAGGTP